MCVLCVGVGARFGCVLVACDAIRRACNQVQPRTGVGEREAGGVGREVLDALVHHEEVALGLGHLRFVRRSLG